MISSLLIYKIVPLYGLIMMGYLAGKLLNIHRDSFAQVLFFMITPVVIFYGVVNTRLDANVMVLPLITFIISSCLCLVFYKISKLFWKDSTRNLLAFNAGSANTGYFGLPVAIMLFDEQGVGAYIMALLGMTLFDNSLGYFMMAKGSCTANECFRKLLKLPTLYAFVIGIIWNMSHIPIPTVFDEFIIHLRGAYTVLGMMIVGLGLSSLRDFKLDYKFIGMSFLIKFAVWPLIILGIIACDDLWFGFFNKTIDEALLLMSFVPLAANSVILASLLKNQPEKAATAVVLSLVFAIVYIPLMVMYFLQSTELTGMEQLISTAVPD